VNAENSYDHINISVNNRKGCINQISRTSIHSGTTIMKLAIKILQKMGVTECELQDNSTFLCNINKNGLSKKVNINYRITMLLKKEKTYYMQFGFIPISQRNRSRGTDLTIFFKNEINEIRKCSWEDLDTFMKKIDTFMIENRLYPILYKEALHNWNEFKIFYQTMYDKPFHAFNNFKMETCHLFTTWFSFYINVATEQFKLYSSIIEKELFINCKFISLNNIYEELLFTKWINSNIQGSI